MKNNKGQIKYFGIIIIVIFMFMLIIAGVVYKIVYSLYSSSETITIKEKWVKYHNSDAKYLVSSTDNQVFQITDTFVRWRFDSSNLYAQLSPGMTCTIETQGWRFPLFSDYKNIIKAEC